ncbi:hypothetical protein F5Y09DRAFT_333256 [Xylaria sp. FL1042]|nr:hypothetical protein F5Y09DRAFT_333256 [Xylaria sp. FL1042]
MKKASKASIGVELEFLICVAESDQPINTPERFRHGGRPLILPPGVIPERVRHTIENTLSSLRKLGDRVVKSDQEAAADVELFHLRPYVDWTVESDKSVYFPNEMNSEKYVGEYHWFPVEIVSPALWPTEASWEEIRAVVQAIKAEFWVITPPTAGMHYHYGHGKDYIPFRKLRRIAALVIAVDALLAQLHPEYRRESGFCLSNRLYSGVAHARTAAATSLDIDVLYIEARPEVPGPEHWPEPFPHPFYTRTPGLTVPFKRGELTGYTFREDRFKKFEYDENNTGEARPLEIPLAVAEILQCLNAPTVAELIHYSPDINRRPAYSFYSYTHHFYKQPIQDDHDITECDHKYKRTVEFRQMASTMEADEVVAHGKIIVRLCEFAGEAELADFWKLILDCAVAEGHGDWYDVFDLLADLGLISEAKVVQHAVARFRAESEELTINKERESNKNRGNGLRSRAKESRPSELKDDALAIDDGNVI